jgi:hypothetical protein
MKESFWLTSKAGEAMLAAGADRLTPRKWALLACALARRVLHLLPPQPFQDAVDFVERSPHDTNSYEGYALQMAMGAAAEAAAREFARGRQQEAMRTFDLEAVDTPPRYDVDENEGEPADRVFRAANGYAADSVDTAEAAAGSAVLAVQHLFTAVGAARLEAVRQRVRDALTASAEVSVRAMIAFDLAGKADRLAGSTKRRNLQFSIAENMVGETEDEIERRLGQVADERQHSELVALAHLLREQLGNPFRPYHFAPEWRTETVLALAGGIEADRAFDRMPILADALEEAGCDERGMLDHLRGSGPHARGCWVLDLILNREPHLFALPPLVPTTRGTQLGPFTPPPEGMA